MDKEFCIYSQALRLKALGFNEPCFGRWWFRSDIHNLNEEELEIIRSNYFELPEYYILAPTFSQVFKWFREKYGLFVGPAAISYEDGPYLWFFEINSTILPFGTDLGETDDFNTYEEAELACLDKLLEIVESKK